MTTLTALTLNVRDKTAVTDLADSYRLHQRVMSLAVPTSIEDGIPAPRQTAGVLHRLEGDPAAPVLLIQSAGPCDTSHLPATYLAGPIRSLDLAAVTAKLEPKCLLRYTVVAAPVVSKKTDDGDRSRGKKHPLAAAADVERWWRQRCPALGLDLHRPTMETDHPVRVDPHALRPGRKRVATAVSVVRHRAWQIAGTATLQDLDALNAALLNGVGPGKAFGCGLLTVVPRP